MRVKKPEPAQHFLTKTCFQIQTDLRPRNPIDRCSLASASHGERRASQFAFKAEKMVENNLINVFDERDSLGRPAFSRFSPLLDSTDHQKISFSANWNCLGLRAAFDAVIWPN